ncbi:MAG: hypothetical protein ACXAB6_05650 [Candidatus Thorarchaeota archaeon]
MIDGLIKRYKLFLFLGIIIVLISFGVGTFRLVNQMTLSGFDGSVLSDPYRVALSNEALLRSYTEIIPLLGLGFLKLGIGFAIASITLRLKETGENAGVSLEKVNKKPPEMQTPLFARIFPKMLLLGILVELFAVVITIGWMMTSLSVIDLQFSGLEGTQAYLDMEVLNHILEVFAEPIEGLGVALLIGGIAFGLATIVLNLSRQATVLPKKLTEIVTGAEAGKPDLEGLFPKKILMLTVLGILITASGLLPIAFIRAFLSDTITISHVQWENWMFVGIGTMLFAIAFWLLTIVKWLRNQRSNLGQTIRDSAGIDLPPIESPLGITKIVPMLAIIGFLWMILWFVFAWTGIAASVGPIVRPGKAIGMSLIFIGIGLALMTIVVNLRLTALMLPGAFTKIVSAIKGEQVDSTITPPPTNLGALAPRKLFLGIVIGAIIAWLGTFPIAWMRIGATPEMFLILERIIGVTVALGVGTIFFFIGMFFSLIVTFVKGRKMLISEGMESCVYYAMEKTSGS